MRSAWSWMRRTVVTVLLKCVALLIVAALAVAIALVQREYPHLGADLAPWATWLLPSAIAAFLFFVGYLAFEYLAIRVVFFRRATTRELSRWAFRDFCNLLSAVGKSFPWLGWGAYVPATVIRAFSFDRLMRRLRNLEAHKAQELFQESLREIRRLWMEGVDEPEVRRHAEVVQRLSPLIEPDRLLGRALAANVTYLLGDLEKGRRLADQTMRDAKRYEGDRLPVLQWFASYAHANSRLFLGQFELAATILGRLWQSQYMSLSETDRKRLQNALRDRSTVNPLAAVPRHLILASAFAGKSLRRFETQPEPDELITDDLQWANQWYELGVKLSKDGETQTDARNISLHFTHGYMALYRLVMSEDPEACLNAIPAKDDPPRVSQYVRHVVEGLKQLKDGEYEDARGQFKRAKEKAEGNRFLDGIRIPAHAISVARLGKHDEARSLLADGRKYAAPTRSPFYDSLLDAAAVVVYRGHHRGKAHYFQERLNNAGSLANFHGLLGIFQSIGTAKAIR